MKVTGIWKNPNPHFFTFTPESALLGLNVQRQGDEGYSELLTSQIGPKPAESQRWSSCLASEPVPDFGQDLSVKWVILRLKSARC